MNARSGYHGSRRGGRHSSEDTEPRSVRRGSRERRTEETSPGEGHSPPSSQSKRRSPYWKPPVSVHKSREVETDKEKIESRRKQIEYGKATPGYINLQKLLQLEPHLSEGSIPRMPDIYQKCSKRSWDGQIRKWRKALHNFDFVDFSGSSEQKAKVEESQRVASLNKKVRQDIEEGKPEPPRYKYTSEDMLALKDSPLVQDSIDLHIDILYLATKPNPDLVRKIKDSEYEKKRGLAVKSPNTPAQAPWRLVAERKKSSSPPAPSTQTINPKAEVAPPPPPRESSSPPTPPTPPPPPPLLEDKEAYERMMLGNDDEEFLIPLSSPPPERTIYSKMLSLVQAGELDAFSGGTETETEPQGASPTTDADRQLVEGTPSKAKAVSSSPSSHVLTTPVRVTLTTPKSQPPPLCITPPRQSEAFFTPSKATSSSPSSAMTPGKQAAKPATPNNLPQPPELLAGVPIGLRTPGASIHSMSPGSAQRNPSVGRSPGLSPGGSRSPLPRQQALSDFSSVVSLLTPERKRQLMEQLAAQGTPSPNSSLGYSSISPPVGGVDMKAMMEMGLDPTSAPWMASHGLGGSPQLPASSSLSPINRQAALRQLQQLQIQQMQLLQGQAELRRQILLQSQCGGSLPNAF